ncbi:HAD family hydrolase [Chloroflexota bacterium]
MIKAIFFDWFNTLARYEPPREELQSQVLQEFGFDVSPQKIISGLLLADKDYLDENAVSPVLKRSQEEQEQVFIRYQKTILREAGINIPEESDLLLKIIKRSQQLIQGISFVLFDDVITTLQALKEKSLTLGLLTNLDKDMAPICNDLGLEPYLDFTVTSLEAKADKPNPAIFMMALDKARVNASEVVHVGDQYNTDVIGARGVGISPILIDRNDLQPEFNGCPRINSLTEVINYI